MMGGSADAEHSGVPEGHLRADARVNRARILEVADEVFGKGGASASTEEVARLAGVGIATVFRHFPTKAALLEAVFVRRLQRLCDRARGLADTEDPGQAFFDFFAHTVADATGKIAIAEALVGEGGGAEGRTVQASEDLRRAVGNLLERAQEAGTVRGDVELPEVYGLLIGVSRATAHAQLDQEVQARILAVVFDGLAPRGPSANRPESGSPRHRS
jgi:AcrR family transcriptional regulator